MDKQFYKDAAGSSFTKGFGGIIWGVGLWLIGYVLGMILFALVPPNMIGWVIMPIGIIMTLWVLLTKIKSDLFKYYLYLAIIWTLIAIIFDYFFLVKALHPTDGYYKLDVYLYYILTFILPLVAGWWKKGRPLIDVGTA